MKFSKLIFLQIAIMLLVSCSTIIELPMHPVEGRGKDKKSPIKMLVSWSDELQLKSYSTSQLGSTWIYPLGQVIPEMTIKSLSGFFDVVDVLDENNEEDYDFLVAIELLDFTAKVPSTIFSPTKTSVEIEYTLKKVSTDEIYILTAKSNEDVTTSKDKIVYESLTKEVKNLVAYGAGVVITAPKYEHLAARDGMMAIYKCTYDLAAQIDSFVSQPHINSVWLSRVR